MRKHDRRIPLPKSTHKRHSGTTTMTPTRASLILLALAAPLLAQDTRTVIEPTLPPICTTLTAQLTSPISPENEAKLDTARIQKALDNCTRGHAVALRADATHNAFLSGPLELRANVTLLVEKDAILFASRDPKLYETAPGSCGLVNQERNGCKPLLSAKHISRAAVMGEGAIDGRGGATLLNRSVTWWDLAEQARPSGRQQVPRILVADYADDFTLYRITLKNSPNFHVVYNHGDGFTVWGLRIDTPKRGARNTDGVDPGSSKNITITHSFIRTGDDNVAIKGGDPISHMTVAHNHFYYGHGMSIGSETNGGVNNILVTDLSLDGPDNGLRIKSNGSRGGLVRDVTYDDVCIRNSPNPITLDSSYTANGPLQGSSPPTFRDITLRNVRVSGGGKITFNGYDHTHRVAATLNNVLTTDSTPYTYLLQHADVTLNSSNLTPPTGTDSTTQGTPTPGTPASCSEKFVPFPEK
ncbi:glycosyl hydrolase family 28 protein [Granulicella sp. dw_53]|uniref:glycoside hydrolase family 28 protein n=1 Tax=Granulicella sp. dw_53 TaxID=2719792 RepID=UPI00210491DE|nr:glycosyl hydrolase family 28 protein [Granulicella sp. dw_53]